MTSCTTSGIQKALCGLVFSLVLLAANAAPAQAAPPAPGLSAAAPFAEEHWTFSKFIHKYANRAHVVQFCVVCMLLALFVIIKKLDGDGSPRPLPLREHTDPSHSFQSRDRKGAVRSPLPYGRGSEKPGTGSRPDLTPLTGPRDGVSP